MGLDIGQQRAARALERDEAFAELSQGGGCAARGVAEVLPDPQHGEDRRGSGLGLWCVVDHRDPVPRCSDIVETVTDEGPGCRQRVGGGNERGPVGGEVGNGVDADELGHRGPPEKAPWYSEASSICGAVSGRAAAVRVTISSSPAT
ncbi:hypothetical protein QE411_003293 [Microbacterium arborescens]|nr:hypothetical protein [Microbacterium arborescens]